MLARVSSKEVAFQLRHKTHAEGSRGREEPGPVGTEAEGQGPRGRGFSSWREASGL